MVFAALVSTSISTVNAEVKPEPTTNLSTVPVSLKLTVVNPAASASAPIVAKVILLVPVVPSTSMLVALVKSASTTVEPSVVNDNVSVPAPPVSVSALVKLPVVNCIVSSPPPPMMLSAPVPPVMMSLPVPVEIVLAPAVATTVSTPVEVLV